MSLRPERGERGIVMMTLLAMSVACVTVSAAPPPSLEDNQVPERWMADDIFYDVYSIDEKPQADSNGEVGHNLCPPVPKSLPAGGCLMPKCSSDRECQKSNLKCCYNGCVYTCLPEVKPSPHFDWFREPRRRHQSGQSWLIPGPGDLGDVETCTTTPPDDNSDPLMCPHGFECSIMDEGNPRKGVPNRGKCIKSNSEIKDVDGDPNDNKDLTWINENEDSELRHACDLDEGQKLLSGHKIVIDGQKCLCFEKNLVCDN